MGLAHPITPTLILTLTPKEGWWVLAHLNLSPNPNPNPNPNPHPNPKQVRGGFAQVQGALAPLQAQPPRLLSSGEIKGRFRGDVAET